MYDFNTTHYIICESTDIFELSQHTKLNHAYSLLN
jgi:hypothetical protein